MDDSGSNKYNYWGLPTINHRKRSDAGSGTDASQAPAEHGVLNIQGQRDVQNEKDDLNDWQIHFSKLFHNPFQRRGRIH